MKKGLVEIVFILDKSGSMSGLEADTIGGYNSFLKKQRGEDVDSLVSTVLFSDRSEVVHDRVPIADVEAMTESQYSVGGSTALLDAVGDAIAHIRNVHKYAREEDRPEKTVFVITTDGEENSSRRRSRAEVKKMVEKQKEEFGWEFVFLGANMDAVSEAAKIGIEKDRAVTYECDSEGTAVNFECMGNLLSRISRNVVSCVDERTGPEWKDGIELYRKSKLR